MKKFLEKKVVIKSTIKKELIISLAKAFALTTIFIFLCFYQNGGILNTLYKLVFSGLSLPITFVFIFLMLSIGITCVKLTLCLYKVKD